MKTWLITGASTGIGRGIAEAVLRDGNRAVVTARDSARLSDLVGRYPQTALALSYEATRNEAAKGLVNAAIEHFSSIDVLVCNAGCGHSGTAEDSDLSDVRTLFETNFFGPAALVQAALPHMRATGNGVIATVSSMGVNFRGAEGNGFYVASKAALEGYSEILRNEVAQFGIRVCVIEPGSFWTEFRRSASAPTSTPIHMPAQPSQETTCVTTHTIRRGIPCAVDASSPMCLGHKMCHTRSSLEKVWWR